MRIILWGINYRPESTGIAPFNSELAEYLAQVEHDVAVVTGFPYYPRWQKERADRWAFFRRDRLNGVNVFRCAQYVPARVTTLRRIVHEFSFGIMSLLRVLCLPRADVYIVVSPPLFLGFCAWIATRVKRSRYVFHVQDIQPGAAVGLGMVKGRRLIRSLYALERFAYRHAAAVSGISAGMMNEFSRKDVAPGRRIYFPNWLRSRPAIPMAKGEFRRRFGIPSETLLAIYSGNLGRKQGIEILIEAARQLALREIAGATTKVAIVIAGAGAERDSLARHVAALAWPGLRLLPLLSEDDYARMLADADIGLITQVGGTGQYFFPSKLLSLLQAGLPVATVADPDSELARAVADGGFGINVETGQAATLAAVLVDLSANRARLGQLAARTGWVERFAPSLVLPQFARELVRICGGEPRTTTLVSHHEPSRL